MTTIAHDYCDIMDGPIYESIPTDHEWCKLISSCIPDEEETFKEIAAGAGVPIVKMIGIGRYAQIAPADEANPFGVIERQKAYLRIRIAHESVVANNTDGIHKTIRDGWRKLGEAIKERNQGAVVIHAHADTVGHLYAGSHWIFIGQDTDEFGILCACYYFALHAGEEFAKLGVDSDSSRAKTVSDR